MMVPETARDAPISSGQAFSSELVQPVAQLGSSPRAEPLRASNNSCN